MDSQLRMPSSSYEEEAPPPSYSDSNTYSAPPPASQYYSSQIRSQLSNLATQISSTRIQRELLSNAQDEKILSLLTNDIQIYLSDFSKTSLKKGTLILIPGQAVGDENALPTDFDFLESDEFARLVRVKDKGGENYGESNMWYWRDEDMAGRLAGYLRPMPDPRTAELPPRREELKVKAKAATSTSRNFWAWKKGKNEQPVPQERRRESGSDVKNVEDGAKDGEDKVNMEVKAEELVFRSETDLGLLVCESGYAIVVKLRVESSRK